jgi:pseudomonalisin
MGNLKLNSLFSLVEWPCSRQGMVFRWMRPLLVCVLLAVAISASSVIYAQTVNRVTQDIDPAIVETLPNHHPLWANEANSAGLAPSDRLLDSLTIVLSRSPQQEQAFEAFLAGQQDPASPDYHHWLTPTEVGRRFGLSDQDLASVSGWLQSQGLHVNWVSPSRIFIGFGGTAADVGRAFHTEMRIYNTGGVERISVSSAPMIPAALVPVIKAIQGLYTVDDQPLHSAVPMRSDSPEENSNSGSHFLAPADFATIYDLPSGATGIGQTIGIVGRSRTDFADFENFQQKTETSFAYPT